MKCEADLKGRLDVHIELMYLGLGSLLPNFQVSHQWVDSILVTGQAFLLAENSFAVAAAAAVASDQHSLRESPNLLLPTLVHITCSSYTVYKISKYVEILYTV